MHPSNLRNQPWWPSVEPLFRSGATMAHLGLIFRCSARSIKRQMGDLGLKRAWGRPLNDALGDLLGSDRALSVYEVHLEFTEPWPGRPESLRMRLAAESLPQLLQMFDHVPSDVRLTVAVRRKGRADSAEPQPDATDASAAG